MKDINKQIEESLKYDALQEAENITGKSYKEDKLTTSIGFASFLENNEKKEQLLSSIDDTVFSETEENYMRKVVDFGFKEVLLIPFVNEKGVEERLHIMWHDEYSILLSWDTHTCIEVSRNGGNFYFNWIPNDILDRPENCSNEVVSNGDGNSTYSFLFNKNLTPHILPKELRDVEPKIIFDNYDQYKINFDNWRSKVKSYIADNNLISICEASCDCREAIKFNINRLSKKGCFVNKWKKQPFMWLLHYMDKRNEGYDYKSINEERISMLPKYIQESIKGE